MLTAREVRLLASDLVFTAHNGILDCRVEPLTRDVLELDLDVDQMRRVLQAVTWLAALLAEETPARARRAMVAFSEVNEQEGP